MLVKTHQSMAGICDFILCCCASTFGTRVAVHYGPYPLYPKNFLMLITSLCWLNGTVLRIWKAETCHQWQSLGIYSGGPIQMQGLWFTRRAREVWKEPRSLNCSYCSRWSSGRVQIRGTRLSLPRFRNYANCGSFNRTIGRHIFGWDISFKWGHYDLSNFEVSWKPLWHTRHGDATWRCLCLGLVMADI